MIVLTLDGRMDGSSASGHGRSGERGWRAARHVGIVAGAVESRLQRRSGRTDLPRGWRNRYVNALAVYRAR